jgi:zinc transport system substrate-binding protein
MRLRIGTWAVLWVIIGVTGTKASGELRVIASIKPIHSLVAMVMGGVATPRLLIPGTASPHHYVLKPSDAGALQRAQVIVWVGANLEQALKSPIANLGRNAGIVTLADSPGLTLLNRRAAGTFSEAASDVVRDHDSQPAREPVDMHLWLDPINAKVMLARIAAGLAAADPVHAVTYRANQQTAAEAIDALMNEINVTLGPVRSLPFIVFHDAFHYFEARFDLKASGAITRHPEIRPGARSVRALRDQIHELGPVCVFAEPQFSRRLIDAIIDGLPARLGTLDPIGRDLQPGPGLYGALLRGLAGSMRSCLTAVQ